MKNIQVVICCGYGDSGKGIFTDYLASKVDSTKSIVVRHSGSANAGHTVVTPEGQTHVFGHFGSGTFLNVPTYLSKYFISNPIAFKIERETLLSKNVNPIVWISDESRITTPYDMIINQHKELKRSKDKHGSCGMGIHQTMTLPDELLLTYGMMRQYTLAELKSHLDLINIHYNDVCVDEALGDRCLELLNSDIVLTKFIKDCEYLIHYTVQYDFNSIYHEYDNIIFESSQGLLLDQDHTNFPHVTHAKTGIHNVLLLMLDKPDELNIYYITRYYKTRHGAGPMLHEGKKPHELVKDKTNVPNMWQDSLRYGLLDVNKTNDDISKDFFQSGAFNNANMNLVITCMDQAHDNIDIVFYDEKQTIFKTELADHFTFVGETNFKNIYESYGPTRDTLRNILE